MRGNGGEGRGWDTYANGVICAILEELCGVKLLEAWKLGVGGWKCGFCLVGGVIMRECNGYWRFGFGV